ncbi:MAG TPA: hypothetical protein VD995_25660 [Azospirillum sp.]|nr:hypothetical protein [Azospirillum sp.]
MDARALDKKSEIEFLNSLGGRSPRERRLALLLLILYRGGQIMPTWALNTPAGFVYWPGIVDRTQELLTADLEYLAANDYLNRIHFDRVHRCPGCGSYQLNMREVCVECRSANIESLPVMHHFRCGYVAPIGDFESQGKGRECPKCGHTMRNLGTDHEIVGELVRCRSCSITFDEPAVEASCFRCGSRTPVEQLVQLDVWGFKLTALGQSAAKAGRLFDEEDERLIEPGSPLYRRSVFLKLLRNDLRLNTRYGIPYTVIALRLGYRDDRARLSGEPQVIETIMETLRSVDQIGRFSDDALLVKLPATDQEGGEVVRRRLAERIGAIDGVQVTATRVSFNDESSMDVEIARALGQQP